MEQQQDVVDDAGLVAAVRFGQHEAFAELYRRHAVPVTRYARRVTGCRDEAGDIVAETFTRLFALLSSGRGPTGEFRPYVIRMVRNIAFDRRVSARRVEPTDEPAVLEQVVPFHDPAVERCERQLVGRAFAGLPPRWQEVLWLICVEGRSVDDVAARLGLKPNAVTSLAYRAREGLRQAYLSANVNRPAGPGCSSHRTRLAALVRGGLGPAARARAERHLAECRSCREDLRELEELNGTLRDHCLSPRGPGAPQGPAPSPTSLEHDPEGRHGWAPGRVA